MEKVLVIEDEIEIRNLIQMHLIRQNFNVTVCSTSEEGNQHLKSEKFDVLVVDWMLPGQSGVELIKKIKLQQRFQGLSVLMVTAKAEPEDIVTGLDAGADDYLVKPFEPAVLLARVRALIRRFDKTVQNEDSAQSFLKAGDIELDLHQFQMKCAGEHIPTTPSEFKLVQVLIQNKGRVLTREKLIASVQGDGVSVVGRTIDTHVFMLRKKMGPSGDLIETIRGIGYRIKT